VREQGNFSWRVILLVCGAIPFVLINTVWSQVACMIYSLTGGLFGILLVGEYPPADSSWFWKAMFPIIVLHIATLSGLGFAIVSLPEIHRLPRVLYGVLAVIGMLEYRACLRILEAFRPK